jgi:hypothetical protein
MFVSRYQSRSVYLGNMIVDRWKVECSFMIARSAHYPLICSIQPGSDLSSVLRPTRTIDSDVHARIQSQMQIYSVSIALIG